MLLSLNVLNEVVPVSCAVVSLFLTSYELCHREGLVTLLTWTNISTVATTCTVENWYLNTELHSFELLWSDDVECLLIEVSLLCLIQYEWTDTSVRTNVWTLVTLDTVLCIPLWNEGSNTTLVECSCTYWPCTVNSTMINEVRNLQEVTWLCVHWTNKLFNECWCIVCLSIVIREVSPSWVNSQLLVLVTTVNSSKVLVYDILTLLAVTLNDELLHLVNCKVERNNLCNTEECRLEDSVGTVTETNLLCNLCSIDIVNGDIVLSEVALYLIRNEVYKLLTIKDSVQQECTILTQTTCNVVHVQVSLNVTSNEVWSIYLICRADWVVTETEVRTCETTRLLRVVWEVSLTVLISVVTDNLYWVLVSTNGTVSTKTIELSLVCAFTTQWNLLNLWERSEGNVINDTYCEVVLWLWQLEVVINSDNLSWCCIWRTKTITTTNDQWLVLNIVECALNIEVQWLTLCTWLLSTVKNSDALNRLWNCSEQVLNREWTIKVYSNHTNLLTLRHQVVDSLTSCLSSWTHQDDDVLCILSTIVIEEMILTASNLWYFAEIVFNNLCYILVSTVRCLTVCEECLWVLSCTTNNWTLWWHSTVTETLDILLVN